MTFQEQILEGIPNILPKVKPYDQSINHAPRRKDVLSAEDKKLALKNALRYFDKKHHKELISDFKDEKIIEGDNVEVTFYIKGIDKNGHVVNNLYADRIAVLKRQKAKKDTE